MNKLKTLLLVGLSSLILCSCSQENPFLDEASDVAGDIANGVVEEVKRTFDDGILQYDADKRWDDFEDARCLQIMDVFIYEGEIMKDLIEEFDNSEYMWEVVYNPEADVEDTKTLEIGFGGDTWLIIEMANYTDEHIIYQEDAVVTKLELGDLALARENTRVFRDYYYSQLDEWSEEDLKSLDMTLFKDADVKFKWLYQTDTDENWVYTIIYSIGTERNYYGDDYKKPCGYEVTYTFNYRFEDGEEKMTLTKFYGFMNEFEEKDYYEW